MELPIESVLSGMKLDVARLQDRMIEIIYDYVQTDAVLYGGTAVWRCFNGGRFSEGIDTYVGPGFEKRFRHAMEDNGLRIEWQDEEFPLNMRIADGKTQVLLEAKNGLLSESMITQYLRVDGTSMTISALSPAELMIRKLEAYGGRRYIRDMYDIVQLTNYLDNKDQYILPKLRAFLKSLGEPSDADILEALVYKGRAMSFDEMAAYLRRWTDEV